MRLLCKAFRMVCECLRVWYYWQLMNKGGRIRHVDISLAYTLILQAPMLYTFRRLIFQRGRGFQKGTPPTTYVSVVVKTYVFYYNNYKRCRFRFKHLKRPLIPFTSPYTGKMSFSKKKMVESFFVYCVQSIFMAYLKVYRYLSVFYYYCQTTSVAI